MHEPRLIYFSSLTENTKIFVEQLAYPSERLPLFPKDKELEIGYPYILFVPTYGAGHGEAAVPPQVKRFFNHVAHRKLCVGVVGAGNMNFGIKYAAAGDVVSKKIGVPVLYRFELRGTATDVVNVNQGISDNWEKLLSMKGIQ